MFGESRYNEENILVTCIIITVKRNKKKHDTEEKIFPVCIIGQYKHSTTKNMKSWCKIESSA